MKTLIVSILILLLLGCENMVTRVDKEQGADVNVEKAILEAPEKRLEMQNKHLEELSTPVLADNAATNFGDCMVDALNGKERKQLAKQIFLSMAAHPEINSYLSATNKDIIESDEIFGKLFTRLITNDCPEEVKKANNSDPLALQKSFELVGQVAMLELMTNKNVMKVSMNFIQYVDQEKINSVLAGTRLEMWDNNLKTLSTPALKDNAVNSFGDCMIDALNGKERKQLARQSFFSMAAHPDINSYFSGTTKDMNKNDEIIGELITRLTTSDCPEELKEVNKFDPLAMQKSFELVGQVAGQELATHKNVIKAAMNFLQYVDQEKIDSLLAEK